jgi:hypothetical protein
MKSQPILDEFNQFCFDNPNMRFWQALSAFVGDRVYVQDYETRVIKDTFYWEGRNEINPPRDGLM